MSSSVDKAISTLNSLRIGEIERLLCRLDEVRGALGEIGEPELLDTLEQARSAITQGDLPLFRKRVQHVISRLGHLR